jgi:hypothetical protein
MTFSNSRRLNHSFVRGVEVTRILILGLILVLAACTTNATETPTSSGVTLRVAVWDYTLDGMTEQPEVKLLGRDSWFPEIGGRLHRREYPDLPLGTTQTFVFDPLGINQFQISVELPITDALCRAGCNSDTVNLGIWDDRIAVWGPFEQQIVDRARRPVQGDRNRSVEAAYEELKLVPSK